MYNFDILVDSINATKIFTFDKHTFISTIWE